MKREARYEVLKISDVADALSADEKSDLIYLTEKVAAWRSVNDKPEMSCVVVEADWPMYEDVWRLVEDWVDCKPGGKTSTADLWRKYKSTDNPVTKSSLREIIDRRLGVSGLPSLSEAVRGKPHCAEIIQAFKDLEGAEAGEIGQVKQVLRTLLERLSEQLGSETVRCLVNELDGGGQ